MILQVFYQFLSTFNFFHKRLISALVLLLCVFYCAVSYGQNIEPGNLSDFNPGNLPYANSGGPNGKGAQIAVPFRIKDRDCFSMGNRFELLLSDKDGVFSANPTVIGTVNWHFATFINGFIPAVAAGNGYKLRIRTTSPVRVTDVPGTISIVNSFATAQVNLACTSTTSGGALGDVAFGTCDYVPNATYTITNNTVSTASVTAKVFLDSIAKEYTSLTFTQAQKNTTLQVNEGYYSLIATATVNGTVSTKAYPVLNCRKNFAFNLESGNECIDQEYRVRFVTEGLNSVYRNYPGFIYRVSWGDNGKDSVMIAELRDSLGKIGHSYKKNTSSCGIDFKDDVNNKTYYNRYKVVVTGEMPFCDPEITVKPARVSKPPVIDVRVPGTGLCVNNEISFDNKSKPGEDPSALNEADCNGLTKYYFTIVNAKGEVQIRDQEVVVPSGAKPEPFKYRFTEHGAYKMLIRAFTGGCPSDTSLSFCISAEPRPFFKVDKTNSTFCIQGTTPAKIKMDNYTNVDSLCSSFIYEWALLANDGKAITPGPSTYRFIASTNAGSRNAQIEVFNKGDYKIRLRVGSSSDCGLKEFIEPLVVFGNVTVSLKQNIPAICQNTIIDARDPDLWLYPTTSTPEKGLYYKWTIDPPNSLGTDSYSIDSADIRYPKITFKKSGGAAKFLVSLEVWNDCNNHAKATTAIEVSPTFEFTQFLKDDSLCNVDISKVITYELTGENAPVATYSGRWWCTNAPEGIAVKDVKILSPLSYKTKVELQLKNGLPGTYTFEWRVLHKQALCEAIDDVNIKLIPKLEAGITKILKAPFCSGDTATLAVIGFGGDIVAWEYSPDRTNWTTLDPIFNGKDTINIPVLLSGFYRAVIRACGTNPVFSQDIYVDVKPLPVSGALSGSQNVCENELGELILKNAEPNATLVWYKRETGKAWEIVAGQNTIIYKYTGLTKTTEFKVEVSKNACPVFTQPFTVNVSRKPVFVSDTLAVCSTAGSMNVDFKIQKDLALTGNPTVKYIWTIADPDIFPTVVQNGSSITFSPINNTKTHRVLKFKVTPVYEYSWGLCAGAEGLVEVTVLPNIAFTNTLSDTTACPGSEIKRSYVNNAAPLVDGAKIIYKWEILDEAKNGIWLKPNDGDATSGYRETIPVFTANNTKSEVQKNVVRITPIYVLGDFQCEGVSLKYGVDIVPGTKPEAGPFEILCETTTHKFRGVNDAPAGITGTWSVVPNDNLVFDNIHKKDATVSGLKPGTSYTFKWTFTGGTCSVFDTTVVTVLEKIKASYTKSAKGSCEPEDYVLTNTSTPQNGLTFKWYLNGDLVPSTSRNLKLSAEQVKRDTTGEKEFEDTYHIVKLVAEYPNCQSSTFQDTVVIYAQLKAGIAEKDNTLKICGKKEIQLINLTKGANRVKTDYKIEVFNAAKDKVFEIETSNFTTQKVSLPEVLSPDTYTIVLSARNNCSPGYSYDTLSILAFPKSIISGLKIASTYLYGCGPHTIKIENATTGADRYLYEIYKKFGTDSLALIYSKFTNRSDSWLYTLVDGGEYRIKLTSSNSGCASEVTQHIDVTVGASNAKFALSRPDKTYCVGSEIGIIFPGGKVDSYQWDYGDGTLDNTVNPKKQYSKPGIYIIKAIGTKYLLGFTECVSSHSDTVTIIDRPKAEFTSNATATNCAPFTLDVKCSTSNPFYIEWDFGDPSGQSNKISGMNATHQYIIGGTYTVKMKVYNQTGCADSIIQTVTVSPKPIASLAAKQIVCGSSATLKLEAADNPTHTGLVYEWRLQGKSGLIGPSARIITYQFNLPTGVTPPYSDIVQLIIKNQFTGCSDTTYQEIEYKAKPVPKFTVLNTTMVDCVPFKILVRNDTQFKNDVDQYEWVLDGVTYPGENPVFPDLNAPNKVYKLKLRVHNYDCNYVMESAEVSFSTRPMPIADFELKETQGCFGQAVFEVKTNNSTALLTNSNAYRWIIDGVHHSSLYNPPTKALFKGEHTIQLIVSNGFCSDTTEKTISVINLEKPQVIASAITGCGSQAVLFSARYLSDAKKFFWDFGDGYTDTVKNPVHVFYSNAAGNPYFVKLRVMNGDCYQDAEPVQITIYSKPLVNFQALPDSVIKMPNFTFNFQNLSENKANATYTYNWFFGDGGTSKSRDPDHTYATYGQYKVKLTVINEFGCDSTITRNVRIDSIKCFMYVPNAFQPNNNTPDLQVFKPKAVGLKNYRMRIFSRYGEKIYESIELDAGGIPKDGWNGTLSDKVTPAPQGVYIWDISGDFFDGTIWPGMSFSGPNGKKVRTGTLTLIR